MQVKCGSHQQLWHTMSVAGMYPLNRAILRSPSLRSKSYLCRPKFSRLDVGRWAKKKLSSVRAQGEPVTCQHFSISRHSGFISDSQAEHVRYCTHPPKARHILRSPTHTCFFQKISLQPLPRITRFCKRGPFRPHAKAFRVKVEFPSDQKRVRVN